MKINGSRERVRKWMIAASVVPFTFAIGVFVTVGLSKFTASQAPQIHVVNETQALQLVALETTDLFTRLAFRNISAKSLTGFVLSVPGQGKVELARLQEGV